MPFVRLSRVALIMLGCELLEKGYRLDGWRVGSVRRSVGWSVGRLVGWLVGRFQL
jgi:hypothetical protein